MRLLLTGATGFVGRNLILRALENPAYDEIIVPVRDPKKLASQLDQEGVIDRRKIRVVPAAAPGWAETPFEADHVVHAAGVLMAPDPESYDAVNVRGTLRLLELLRGTPKIVVLSSHAAAGPCLGTDCRKEDDPDAPVTWYGRSKLQMEKAVRERHGDANLVFLRPPMVLGARDTASLPLFMIGKQPIQVKPGLRDKLYSFISVKDLARAIDAVLGADVDWSTVRGRHFFVCSPTPVSDRDLVSGAARTFRRTPRVVPVPQAMVRLASLVVDSVPAWRRRVPNLSRDRANEIWPDRWVISPRGFEQTFGWRAEDDLLTTLEDTHRWFAHTGQV